MIMASLASIQLVEVVEAFRDSANPPRRPQKSSRKQNGAHIGSRQFWRSAMTCQVLVVVVEDAKSKAHPSHSIDGAIRKRVHKPGHSQEYPRGRGSGV